MAATTSADRRASLDAEAPASEPLLLRTAVVGSYSVPEWLGRFKTDYHLGRVSAELLNEVNEMAIKAALVDQHQAGIDIVSDGEFRRDNDMDYFITRLPGVVAAGPAKSYYFDYLDVKLEQPLPEPRAFPGFGLVDDFDFVRPLTTHEVTVSMPGPFSLSRRLLEGGHRNSEELVLPLAALLGQEARSLQQAGATRLQIDEPFIAGYPEAIDLAVKAINRVTEQLSLTVALHVCYGNRYARPAWEGHYDFLFPSILEANVHELVLEFARKGLDDLELFRRYPNQFALGCGVVDVKTTEIESPQIVATRLRQALRVVPPERLVVNPDCGLRHLPSAVARAKLAVMVEGARVVRAEILGERPEPPMLRFGRLRDDLALGEG
jgi:5-methyltetrahydropteroyltriglutamate--homocysteine methyltransferase